MLKKLTLGSLAAFVALNLAIAAIALISTRDRDLSIPETAIAFQEAVFVGNYEAMWDLSGPEYRDGLTREQFIERSRETASPPVRVFDWTVLNETSGSIARVHTRVQLASGQIETHRLMLRNVDGVWRITEYGEYDGTWPPTEPGLSGS